MYTRAIHFGKSHSFFLFGPRGTGKSTWTRETFKGALLLDLLKDSLYTELLGNPSRLEAMIEARPSEWVIIDEIQKIPSLLDEVHRLIEDKKQKFVLTGSSARKLKRGGANLLAGRARMIEMHPLTAEELGGDFSLKKSLAVGQLPLAYTSEDPSEYLKGYIGAYLKEEVQQEAMVRNLDSFAKFLQVASFSQGSVLNVKQVASDCAVGRTTVENYFNLVEDLLIGARLPVFQRKAKRKMVSHPKFYYFDCGVYRMMRPRGPLDPVEQIEGPAIETLVFQELRAHNANRRLGYDTYFWRTQDKCEVDFVLYGERGLLAIEVKRSSVFRDSDIKSLAAFFEDYRVAKCFLLYGGSQRYKLRGIEVWPLQEFLPNLGAIL